MDYYLLSSGDQALATPIKLFDDPAVIKLFSSPLGWKVLTSFSGPNCPMDVAKQLGIHEQKVYYYIKKFKAANLLKEVGKEQRHGTVARFYQVRDSVFGVRVGPGEGTEIRLSSPGRIRALDPFIKDGRLNARIVVGSPDPHGPFKARASDACCAIDLALFLGSLTDGKSLPNYRLDVELRERDVKGNLIVIGGPTVNMITQRINDSLPILFDLKGEIKIISRLSRREYADDENGIISVTENPFDPTGKVLLLAGKRFPGTRSAVLGFINNTDKVLAGNKFDPSLVSRVVKGYDIDGDGIVDSAELLE
ncbi:MAG: hypothetical protein HY369_02565 [Candidatus Aenigmarchaeota archaeon]|nr:hypothetical protein [Candidatus Aenigmarchaeota archaeon]